MRHCSIRSDQKVARTEEVSNLYGVKVAKKKEGMKEERSHLRMPITKIPSRPCSLLGEGIRLALACKLHPLARRDQNFYAGREFSSTHGLFYLMRITGHHNGQTSDEGNEQLFWRMSVLHC